jgi:hypothetical protein
MATGKGVIQGYTGVAKVDEAHQIIVDAQAHGTGAEQELLAPVIKAIQPYRGEKTLIAADAGYHSKANCEALARQGIEAFLPDSGYRKAPTAESAVDRMKHRIDSAEGKRMITRRFATVEPVFGNLRGNRRLDRFTLRGREKVDGQWKLYCLVHNIEKLAHHRQAA